MIKRCVVCNKKIEITHYQAKIGRGKYCSQKCCGISKREKPAWNKGKVLGKRKSYSAGSNNPQWKGGKRKTNQGYIYIWKPNHILYNGERSKGRYVFEHRLVMEKIIGRPLKHSEKVHHINGIRDDNRPENLHLYLLGKNWHPCLCPKCGFEFLIK